MLAVTHPSRAKRKERKSILIKRKPSLSAKERFFFKREPAFFSVPFLRRLKKVRREKKKPSEQRGGEDQKMSLGRQKRGSSSSSSATSSLRFCLLSLHDQNLTASAEASSASSCFWHLPHQQAGSAAKEEGEEARNNTFL